MTPDPQKAMSAIIALGLEPREREALMQVVCRIYETTRDLSPTQQVAVVSSVILLLGIAIP